MANLNDYLSLITSEYRNSPNFMALVQTWCQPFVDIQNFYLSIPGYYDIDYAIGAQLDVVGQWVGLSRSIDEPISGVYFSLDTIGLGLDQGFLFDARYNSLDGLVNLDDETYRAFLKVKAAANSAVTGVDGTVQGLQNIFQQLVALFPGAGNAAYVIDNNNLSFTVLLLGTLPAAVQSLIAFDYLKVKPMTIQMAVVATSVPNTPVMALDVENTILQGLDQGALATIINTI